MTSTINPTTTLPRSHVSRRPSGIKFAVAGAAAAVTLLGLAISQNQDSATVQAPTAVVSVAPTPPASLATEATPELLAAWAARAAQGQAAATAAATVPEASVGPNFEQPATWTEWSVTPATGAATGTAAGPNFEQPATWTEWSVTPVAVAPNFEQPATWTEWSVTPATGAAR